MEKNNFPELDRVAYHAMLVATILASSMAFIDGTALNVALPVIQADLALNGKQLIWIVNGYMVFLSSLMLTGGALGDYYGRKRVFTLGILLFSLSSVICGLSTTGTLLIASRCLQGVGAALMVPGSLSLITALVPSRSRGKAIGWWSMFSALTTTSGPVLGGWLSGTGLWRIIFFLNIPLALVALWMLFRYVPEPHVEKQKNLDWPGALLGTLFLAGISYGLIEAGESGFSGWQVISALSLGAVTGILFIIREFRTSAPMLPPSLFANLNFTTGNLVTILMYASLGGFLLFYPLNLIQVQGYSPQLTGLTMVPFALLIAGMSWITGKWVDSTGPRTMLILGQMLLAIGYFLFSMPGVTGGPPEFFSTYFIPLLLLGTGMGLSVVPVTTTVMNSIPESRSGMASGVNNTLARASQVIAMAVLGGMALAVFQENVLEYLQSQAPELTGREGLNTELKNLAEAELPGSGNAMQEQVFTDAVKHSFVLVFRMAALIASILTAVSTLLVYGLIKRKK